MQLETQDAGIIQLYPMHSNAQYDDELFLRPKDFTWSTAAYIITRKGMEDVISHFFDGTGVLMTKLGLADDCLYRATKSFTVSQPLAYVRFEDSTIHPERDDLNFRCACLAKTFWKKKKGVSDRDAAARAGLI